VDFVLLGFDPTGGPFSHGVGGLARLGVADRLPPGREGPEGAGTARVPRTPRGARTTWVPRNDRVRQDDLGARNRRRDLPGTWQIAGCQDDLGTRLSEPVTADNLLLTSYQVLVDNDPSTGQGERRGGRAGPLGPARFLAPAGSGRIRSEKCCGGACIMITNRASKQS